MGPVFVTRAQEDTGGRPGRHRARLHHRARSLRDAHAVGGHRGARQPRAGRACSTACSIRTSRLLRHASYWLLRNRDREPAHRNRGARTARRRAGARRQHRLGHGRRGARAARRHAGRAHRAAACPKNSRGASRAWPLLEPALDIVALARSERAPVGEVARAYFELGVALGLDWLHVEIDRLAVDGSWQATARTGLRDAAMRAHRELTQQVLQHARRADASASGSPAGARSAATRWPLAAHAHRDARRGHRGLRHAHRGRRRRAQPRRAAEVHGCASRSRSPRYERPDALAAVLASVGAPARARPTKS